MTTAGSGAVFFLGTRAHYQVLNQPESRFDVENGNASTETIYQNPSVQELWPKEQVKKEMDSTYTDGKTNWSYCDNEAIEEKEKSDPNSGMKKRSKRRSSEATLCENDVDMKPADLNAVGESATPKAKSRRNRSLLACLSSLARRKRRLHTDQVQYLQHIESVLTRCTYRESCRCFECQSRYFECDESEDYSSDESDYSPRYVNNVLQEYEVPQEPDDEVFVDTVPDDNTSTDLLIENKEKMSVSSEEVEDEEKNHNLEVAAGTPVLLNYLLTHPITCVIQ
ncbi:hypothetical protein K1T71_014076 [Dendrolimus kikuchii]|uniref:Uncharacterized protein n=1 Tax=Dendrolimus kikuchii TaxID=765133 RepID=A0ACC1CEY4_9NEOP|nr:hypothetical protein K1T71_014076 [Dendrolimus kikuchii]